MLTNLITQTSIPPPGFYLRVFRKVVADNAIYGKIKSIRVPLAFYGLLIDELIEKERLLVPGDRSDRNMEESCRVDGIVITPHSLQGSLAWGFAYESGAALATGAPDRPFASQGSKLC